MFPCTGCAGKALAGYLAIIIGALLTILVQSSSIFTSAMTPLVGVGVITLDRMYPLTLGANIGTTFTAILASLAQDSEAIEKSMQVSMCHLFFNISGIILWYPIPFMRKVPVFLAKKLGNTTAEYRWFAVVYLIAMFFLLPALVFGLSVLGWQVLAGVGIPILLFFIIIILINILQAKAPRALPQKLRNWDYLPLWCRSLKPIDNSMQRMFRTCKCCNKMKRTEDAEQANMHQTFESSKL